MLGLCGSHRTGKTTLARAFSKRAGITLVETSASEVFFSLGYNPKADYDFATRLFIQEAILAHVEKAYLATSGAFITDRTPIDLLAYTIADVRRENVSAKEARLFELYLRRCIDATNRHFSALVLLQPGIPVVEVDKSASGNPAYMEHINALTMGLLAREDVMLTKRYISRRKTNLEDRVRSVASTYNMVLGQFEKIRGGLSVH